MYPSEAEPLPPAAFHPPAWREDLLDLPPPPRCTQSRWGGGAVQTAESHQIFLGNPRPYRGPPAPPPLIQGSRRSLRYGRLQ